MTGVNGWAAAQTLLGYGTVEPGFCLYYVWQAYKAHGATTSRSASTATLSWERSDGQHPGDRNPPVGVPVFWGPKASSAAGDVTISLGNGLIAATDWPYAGVVGLTTIDARERQIGRPYLGWAEAIFDQPILGTALAATTSSEFNTSITLEDIMAGPVYIWSEGRGGALIDPSFGGIRLAGEEATVALAVFGGATLSDRAFDVALNLAIRLAEIDDAALLAEIKAQFAEQLAAVQVEPVKPPKA